jgi:uncharacterized protein YbaA (DUF1428 family)
MSKYTDVYLLPVPSENVADYRKLARKAGKIFIRHGAMRYREYQAADMQAFGVVPFPETIELKDGETLVYAAVEFKSESERNKAMKKIMADPDMLKLAPKEPLFDYKRMVYGGFSLLVDLANEGDS